MEEFIQTININKTIGKFPYCFSWTNINWIR